MTRNLTDDERAVLAHVVVDPAGWWAHCQANLKGDPEAALAAKLARWRPAAEQARASPGYMSRLERDLCDDDGRRQAEHMQRRGGLTGVDLGTVRAAALAKRA